MAFNVQDFRSQLVFDGARPNLFQCSMTLPFNGGGADSKFSFMCKSASLPGSSVNPVITHYFGREVKVWGNRQFTEWAVTIVNDEDFVVRNSIERWMNAGNSHVGNLRAESYVQADGGYQRDAIVRQYGKAGDILRAYKFIGMFPIEVSPIELDWGSNDSLEEYSVTFAYQWWESQTTDTLGNSNSIPTEIGT